MRKTSFIFAGVMATIIGNAYATGENTVASKAYVDTKQVKIPVAGTNASTPGESVVTYTDTAGTIGERGFFDYDDYDGDDYWDSLPNGLDTLDLPAGHEGDIITAGTYFSDINGFYESLDSMSGTAGTVVVRNNRGAPYASADIYDGSTTYNAQNNADDLITAGAVQGQITNITNQMNAMPLESITVQLPLECANNECTLWQVGNVGVAHKLYSCTAKTVATDCPACGTGTKKACVDGICKCNACKADGVVASNSSECCSGCMSDTGSGTVCANCGGR